MKRAMSKNFLTHENDYLASSIWQLEKQIKDI